MEDLGVWGSAIQIVKHVLPLFILGWVVTHSVHPLRDTVRSKKRVQAKTDATDPDFDGAFPAVFGALRAVGTGMLLYFIGGAVSIIWVFLKTLVTGDAATAERLVYLSAALATLPMPYLQRVYERDIRTSEWYRGWSHGL